MRMYNPEVYNGILKSDWKVEHLNLMRCDFGGVVAYLVRQDHKWYWIIDETSPKMGEEASETPLGAEMQLAGAFKSGGGKPISRSIFNALVAEQPTHKVEEIEVKEEEKLNPDEAFMKGILKHLVPIRDEQGWLLATEFSTFASNCAREKKYRATARPYFIVDGNVVETEGVGTLRPSTIVVQQPPISKRLFVWMEDEEVVISAELRMVMMTFKWEGDYNYVKECLEDCFSVLAEAPQTGE